MLLLTRDEYDKHRTLLDHTSGCRTKREDRGLLASDGSNCRSKRHSILSFLKLMFAPFHAEEAARCPYLRLTLRFLIGLAEKPASGSSSRSERGAATSRKLFSMSWIRRGRGYLDLDITYTRRRTRGRERKSERENEERTVPFSVRRAELPAGRGGESTWPCHCVAMALMIRSDPALSPLFRARFRNARSPATFRADGRRTSAMTPGGDFPGVAAGDLEVIRLAGVEITRLLNMKSVEFPELSALGLRILLACDLTLQCHSRDEAS